MNWLTELVDGLNERQEEQMLQAARVKQTETVLELERLKKADATYYFPEEVPAPGKKVRAVIGHTDYENDAAILILEGFVVSRSLGEKTTGMAISYYHYRDGRLGSQDFISFRYDNKTKEWSFKPVGRDYVPCLVYIQE